MAPSAAANRLMHETLVLCCDGALKSLGTGFGNLFSQVDYLTKQRGLSTADRMAVQAMRRYSNHSEAADSATWMEHVGTLSRFVATVFQTSIPDELTRLIPRHRAARTTADGALTLKYTRCIVSRWDDQTIEGRQTDGSDIAIDYSQHGYLKRMLREGMQLNLLDSRVADDRSKVTPDIVVVEPDFRIDISALAHCFQGSYGHHPLLYTIERLKPRTASQAMLLGNFAGTALDDIIHDSDATLATSLQKSFREQALQFCTCEDFDAERFRDDAQRQTDNIRDAVGQLFEKGGYDRSKALLEPSFVCEHLGLQGRADLMTSDMKLLVEQKSGKNYTLERQSSAIAYKEEHYVQLLLYYGILRYNFGRTANQVDIRLLYSRYPAAQGLLYVNFYRELFHEAIRLRNQIVATEMLIAREGFGRILPLLRPDVVYRDAERDGYFHHYVEPPLTALNMQLSALTPTERAYYERMMTFVYREQLLQKTEQQEDQDFRRGDMVYVYNYDDEPDINRAILYKGTIDDISGDNVSVKLNDEQQGHDPTKTGNWTIEHASSDLNTTSAIKSLHQLATASAMKRALLLGGRPPQADTSLQLSRPYHRHYDDVLLRAKQARDYFLLIGPPGTGKTSMALRYLVEEELTVPTADILLMSYTNRAVDEICSMLDDAGQDYLRIGNDTSCDPRFRSHLLDERLGEVPKLTDIRRHIEQTRIVVGTTSMLQGRPFIFQLKHFSLAIIDEASQILEPGLVGLLSSDRIDRFILVGDHKQLPAVVQQTEQESAVENPLLTAIGITNCRQSLFERLLRWEHQCQRTQFVGILRRQGRMHPDIAAFPNELFYHDEQLEPVPLEHQLDTALDYDLPSQDETDEQLKQQRVLFFDSGQHDASGGSDKENPAEARIVADMLRRILRFYGSRFDATRTVGVIVPYRNQITMIRREIAQLGFAQLQEVTIDTVERYQGSQRDVIIYSFTVNHPYQLDFLTSNSFVDEHGRVIDRKLNVAITRARKQLLMTGNSQLLSRNPIFEQLIRFCRRRERQ